jgi:RNA polymerase sigma-70 factor (sigma-E family)
VSHRMMGTRDDDFRAFYTAEAERLHRLALLMTRDRERAADAAQEAFVRTYRAWARVSDPARYVRTTLVNIVRNDYRRWLVSRRVHAGAPPAAARREDDVDEALRVATVLSALPAVRRAAVLLRYYEDLPLEMVARILDRPLGTVKSDLHRALKALRPMLDDSSPTVMKEIT